MIKFKQDEIIILLGAGASVDAGILHSRAMVEEIQSLVDGSDQVWQKYRTLFRYLRSAVYYADGLRGLFGDQVLFNIERVVNTLDELDKKESHPLYPFVGAWNPKLVDVAGQDFEYIASFRKAIVERLRRNWVELERAEKASYFSWLLKFQEEYEYPLRVFTLNYDLCVEKACGFEKVQRGFEGRRWDWRLFNESGDDPKPIQLYKLHGSTDWKFTNEGVTYIDSTSQISADEVALIFGTSYKLQYVDPFLFFAYELRRWTLDEARIIVTIGYGFGDEHINGILGQALLQNSARRLLAVGPTQDPEKYSLDIARALGIEAQQVIVEAVHAKSFFEEKFTLERFSQCFPNQPEILPEISNSDQPEYRHENGTSHISISNK